MKKAKKNQAQLTTYRATKTDLILFILCGCVVGIICLKIDSLLFLMRGQCYEKPLEHPLHFATKKGLLKTLPKAKKITPTKIDFSMEKKKCYKNHC